MRDFLRLIEVFLSSDTESIVETESGVAKISFEMPAKLSLMRFETFRTLAMVVVVRFYCRAELRRALQKTRAHHHAE